MEIQQNHKINRYIFLGVIILFALFLFYSLIEFFTAFLAAVMFYVLSKHFAEWLIVKKKWKKSWAAIMVIIISFFIILLPVSLLVALMYKRVIQAGGDIQNTVILPLKHLDGMFQNEFHFSLLTDKIIAEAGNFLTNIISSLVNQGLNLFGTITMMYFFLYFLIVNINRMEAAIIFYLPFKRSKIILFGKELKAQTFSNAVGVPLIAIVQGTVSYLAYLFVGLEQPGFWAVITGITSILPLFGTGLVWIPVAIYLLASDQIWQGIFIFAFGLIVISSLDNLVRFALAKKMADVHPIVTVLGVIIGIENFGITGLVFGPLIISYFLILLRIYYNEYQKTPAPSTKKNESFNLSTFKLPFTNKKATRK